MKSGAYYLIDEMVDTFISHVLRYEVAKIDWTFDVSMVVTIKFSEAISVLDDVASFFVEVLVSYLRALKLCTLAPSLSTLNLS